MNFLRGNGTYLVALVLFVMGGLKTLGFVDETLYQQVVAVLLPTGLFTLRRAMK